MGAFSVDGMSVIYLIGEQRNSVFVKAEYKIDTRYIMLTKQSLMNTFNLINPANISVISSPDNEIGYKLACSLSCVYFENVQYYPADTVDEIIDTTRQLLNQFEVKNNCKIEFLILNLNFISNELDSEHLSKILMELNELSNIENLKVFALLNANNSLMLEKIHSTFTHAQKHQILMLTMNAEPPIKITVETGEHKGEKIFYEYDDSNDYKVLLRETNKL